MCTKIHIILKKTFLHLCDQEFDKDLENFDRMRLTEGIHWQKLPRIDIENHLRIRSWKMEVNNAMIGISTECIFSCMERNAMMDQHARW